MKKTIPFVGAAVLVVAAGTIGAWWTIPPPPKPPQPLPAAATVPDTPTSPDAATVTAAATVSDAATIVIPTAAIPPEPTSTDFAPAASPATASTAAATETPIDWPSMPIDELRSRAGRDEILAMEELARRLVQGIGIPKDQQAGAGWLLRAAQRGSAQSAFNVGVMYERGFVVERDSTKAIEWYRKAAAANIATAKHNLALLLRDGKGAPRDGKEAVELLRSAARQGMAASMFTLGDIYERGDAGLKDPAIALAWFAITAEFERQTSGDGESALGKLASQRAEVLQRVLLPTELERAQQFGRSEFKQIVEALQPPKPAEPAASAATPSAPPAEDRDPPGWPQTLSEQIRVIQQALIDLKFLRDKADGAMGPLTRNAIRTFQRSAAIQETGEPTSDVFAALQDAIARNDPSTGTSATGATAGAAGPGAPLPPAPPASAPPASANATPSRSDSEATKPGSAATGNADSNGPQVDAAKAAAQPTAKPDEPPVATAGFSLPAPDAPPPPTSDEIRDTIVPDTWPNSPPDQVKAIQILLRELRLSESLPDGLLGPVTRKAILDYERSRGMTPTGTANPALFKSMKESLPAAGTKPGSATTGNADSNGPQVDAAKAAVQPAAKPDEPPVATAGFSLPAPDAPPPPTSDEIRDTIVPDTWPNSPPDQVRAIQILLRELRLSDSPPDGLLGPVTRKAILDYERSRGMTPTGTANPALFKSMKESLPAAGQN